MFNFLALGLELGGLGSLIITWGILAIPGAAYAGIAGELCKFYQYIGLINSEVVLNIGKIRNTAFALWWVFVFVLWAVRSSRHNNTEED